MLYIWVYSWNMGNKIIKAEELPEGENVYLKRGITGEWRVVHPWKRDDGSLNWFAIIFGSKGNFLLLIVIMLIAFALYFGVLQLIGAYQEVAANPCGFCSEITRNITFSPEVDNPTLVVPKINFSELNLTSP